MTNRTEQHSPTVFNAHTNHREPSDVSEEDYVPDPPNWESFRAWGYLQSQSRDHESVYLDRETFSDSGRTGYLIGRAPECDMVITDVRVSKRHCLIYVESGNDGVYKGISIYIKDLRKNNIATHSILLGFRLILPPRYEVGTFNDDYCKESRLGEGSFAAVYRGYQKVSRSLVAIKRIDKSRFARKPKMLPSIIEEISILMSLEAHPCIIQIEKVYNEPKYIYLVLQLVEHGDLFDCVSDGPLNEEDTRCVFWQLFSAIGFLHHKEIAHRDLKHENVLVVNKSTLHVKLCDFGLAKRQDSDNSFDSQCGTPNYVAPEILDALPSRAYGKACDLWSIGVMLYVCLSGHPPFSAGGPGQLPMHDQIQGGTYSFEDSPWTEISEQAKDLVRGLLTVDPDNRLNIMDAQVGYFIV
ncbi:kinase-like domain-containing protein [Spinellus fusiger]|nr:kinase-like domain-containing protein [Spinellus fusiger]